MPHNFRIIIAGATYFSKVGNDANVGTDPNLPKISLLDVSNPQTIGTGVYKNAFSLTLQNNTWNCDGYVVMDCTANVLWGNSAAGGGVRNVNTNAIAGTLLVRLNSFVWVNQVLNGTANYNRAIFENGTFRNLTALTSTANLTNCVFANVVFDCSGTTNLNYCSIFNGNSTSTLNNLTSMQNTYADEATVIYKTSWFSSPATNFRNNNFRGTFIIGGIAYELKRDKAGNVINPNPSYLDIAVLDSTVYARGNYSEDMDYLNIEKRGYSAVASTSPALKADTSLLGNIGASTFSATNYEVSTDAGAVDVNLTLSANDLIVTSPATFGTRVTSPIQIAPIPQPIGRVNFRILRNFNSSQAIGSAENSNVTIVDNYPIGHSGGGDNPRRLTYEMRWSVQSSIPTLDAHWDNQGYITAGAFAKFEQNTVPSIDASGRGNGEPNFSLSGAEGLKAKWIQYRITVRNGIG